MKRGRLRSIGRWGVFVVTGLVLVSIPVSVWVKPGGRLAGWRYQDPNNLRILETMYVFQMSDLRIRFVRDSGHSPRILWEAPPEEEWRFELWRHTGSSTSKLEWWARPVLRSFRSLGRGAIREFDCPIVYPAFVMVGWSAWLIWNQRRRRQLNSGCCGGCGYSLEGLDGGVCPECGEGTK